MRAEHRPGELADDPVTMIPEEISLRCGQGGGLEVAGLNGFKQGNGAVGARQQRSDGLAADARAERWPALEQFRPYLWVVEAIQGGDRANLDRFRLGLVQKRK